jgi:hypothetical protein
MGLSSGTSPLKRSCRERATSTTLVAQRRSAAETDDHSRFAQGEAGARRETPRPRACVPRHGRRAATAGGAQVRRGADLEHW